MSTVATSWVPETRIGKWFLRTDLWVRHVVAISLLDLEALLETTRPFERILDIGCGEGPAFALLERKFAPRTVIGIDVDPKLVARAQAAAARCSGHVEARVGDASALDLPDNSVDLIFCHQTLHHLSNQARAVRELYRVLAPGGVLLCAESCRSFIQLYWIRWFFRHPAEVQKCANEYLTLLRETGFEFGPRNWSTPYPPWSRPDFGLSQIIGIPIRADHPTPLIYVAASKSA